MLATALVDAPNSRASSAESHPLATFRIADTRRLRQAAFQLTYRRYLEADLITPNDLGIRVIPHHLQARTTVFVAVEQGQVIGTVTLIGDGPLGLPLENVYGSEVRDRRRRGLYVGEVSCLACEPMPPAHFLKVFTRLTRVMAQHARVHGMHQLLVAAHPQHSRFYERFMGFEQFGALQVYRVDREVPAVACSLDFAAIDRFRPRCYAMYFKEALPEASLTARPMSHEERCFFLPFVDFTSHLVPGRACA